MADPNDIYAVKTGTAVIGFAWALSASEAITHYAAGDGADLTQWRRVPNFVSAVISSSAATNPTVSGTIISCAGCDFDMSTAGAAHPNTGSEALAIDATITNQTNHDNEKIAIDYYEQGDGILQVEDANVMVEQISMVADNVATKAIDVQLLDSAGADDATSGVTVTIDPISGMVPVDVNSAATDVNGKATFTFGPSADLGCIRVRFKADLKWPTELEIKFTA